MITPFYLTFKEIWRNRGRFFLFSLVIALITILVLFIAVAAIAQIIGVTILGVGIGAAATVLLSFTFPATIPIVFSPNAIVLGIASLLAIGPIGGLVSVRYALRVEPLMALGLAG